MASERVERRLSAILSADVVGYSRLMGADEEGTLARLKVLRRSLVAPKIEEHHGRVVKTTGDGMLVEFASMVDAARCALEVQSGMIERNAEMQQDNRIEFRVGIHVGDIIIDDNGDMHGDGVNVASRLEGFADAGGICMSEDAFRQIQGKLANDFIDGGEQQLKNIARPIRVYRLRTETRPPRPALALPDKPSIAVLPFQNMSGDPEQEYFADGIVEEIITALSRMRWLFVIARNSSFVYKGRPVDVKQIGRELGLRYVLEGSVRKAANRVRIAGQLIDTGTGAHLWADRFDGSLDDIFDLQEQITSNVVGAIAPKLEQAEIERAKRKPTESLDAYDCCLRGMSAFHQASKEGIGEALRLFYRAIETDPDFAMAYGMAAWCYVHRKANGWRTDREQEIAEAARLARRAADLGKDDAIALSLAAHALAYVVCDVDIDASSSLTERALILNPNLATVRLCSGWVRIWRGEPDSAIEHITHAIRLSPFDPTMFRMQVALAMAHFLAGRYDDASSWAERALYEQPAYVVALPIAATSHAHAGRLDAAKKVLAELRRNAPWLRISHLAEVTPLRRPDDLARYAEGLRKAGLPE